MAQLLTQHLFSSTFDPERDTSTLNAILSDIYRLLSGQIDSANIATGGVGSSEIAPGAVGTTALDTTAPTKPSSISIVGSLDATSNIRQADVTWAQTGSVAVESWEVRWRVQGESTYLYSQVGTQSFRVKNLRPSTTYEIGVQSISRTGVQSGYAVADESHATGTGDQPPEVTLKVDKLTAGTLSSQVLLSGNIRTADSGARVQMDSGGVKVYNSADAIKLQADTAGLRLFGQKGVRITTVSGSLTARVDGGTSLVADRPSGTLLNGDVLVAFVDNIGGTNVSLTPPTDWVLIRRTGSAAGYASASYYKILTNAAGEPGTYTWTLGTAQDGAAQVLAFRGIDNTTPVDVSTGATGTSSAPVASTLTTAYGAELLLCHFTQNSATNLISGVDGMNTLALAGATAGVPITYTEAIEYFPVPGSTGSRAATASGSAEWVATMVALTPSLSADTVVDLAATSGTAVFRGSTESAFITTPFLRSAQTGLRASIAPISPLTNLATLNSHSGSAYEVYPAYMYCLADGSGSLESPVAIVSAGKLQSTSSGGQTNESQLWIAGDTRDGTRKAYTWPPGTLVVGEGTTNPAKGSDGAILLDTVTAPTSNPTTGAFLYSSSTGLLGRNAAGDTWPWGPIRHFSDTGSDTAIGTVYPSYETMSTDADVSFTTRVSNAIVMLTAQIRAVNDGAGYGGVVATLADGTTAIGTPVVVAETAGDSSATLAFTSTLASPGAYTFRIRVSKVVGAGGAKIDNAVINALVIG